MNEHTLDGTTLYVCYMDYGNSEIISKSRIKMLHQNFATIPVQGFHACVKIPSDVDASSFKDSVLEKKFYAKIVQRNGNNVYEVELFTAGGAKMFGGKGDKKEGK